MKDLKKLIETLCNKNYYFILDIREVKKNIENSQTIFLQCNQFKINDFKKLYKKYLNYKIVDFIYDKLATSLIIFIKKENKKNE